MLKILSNVYLRIEFLVGVKKKSICNWWTLNGCDRKIERDLAKEPAPSFQLFGMEIGRTLPSENSENGSKTIFIVEWFLIRPNRKRRRFWLRFQMISLPPLYLVALIVYCSS